MAEYAPVPLVGRFPDLSTDPRWVRHLPHGTLLARIFPSAGPYPMHWNEFRSFGPVDARFDHHPPPMEYHDDHGVMYAVAEGDGGRDSAFATCLLEVFQHHRVMDLSRNAATLALFELSRPIELLQLSDSDWLAVAGGNAAVSSGLRARSREWARAIYSAYPTLDGVISASTVLPDSRIIALWERATSAFPQHPTALLRLDRPELANVIHGVASRYGFTVL